MNKIIKIIIILIAAFAASYGIYRFFNSTVDKTDASSKSTYTCPMHNQITSDHPGVCPICNMELVLKGSGSLKTGIDSSEYNSELGDVVLSTAEEVLANVRTEKATVQEFSGDITFNGYVKIDEQNIRHISTLVAGKITRMFVNFEGQSVRKGQAIYEIYSPDILATEKEYILATENYERVKNSNYDLVREQAENLVNSTKTRLMLWEVTEEQIEELKNTKEVKNYLTVYSKYSGVILRKIAQEGHWVSAGEDIYDLTDMSRVWVIASVPESEINKIKSNQIATVTSITYPNEEFSARINFVSPVLNGETRTLEVRLDVTNRDYKLKPEMYVKVSVQSIPMQRSIAVPRNAVLRTGKMD